MKFWRALVDSLLAVVVDAPFFAAPSGLSMKVMTAVGFVSLQLPADEFDEWQCPVEFSFGLNLLDLSNVLKAAHSNDEMMWAIPTSSYSSAHPRIQIGIQSDKYRYDYELTLLTLPQLQFEAPQLPFTVDVGLDSASFLKSLRASLLVSPYCSVHIRHGTNTHFLVLESNNSTSSLATFNEVTTVNTVVDSHRVECYPVKHLILIGKLYVLSPTIYIHTGVNQPLECFFRLGAGGSLSVTVAEAEAAAVVESAKAIPSAAVRKRRKIEVASPSDLGWEASVADTAIGGLLADENDLVTLAEEEAEDVVEEE